MIYSSNKSTVAWVVLGGVLGGIGWGGVGGAVVGLVGFSTEGSGFDLAREHTFAFLHLTITCIKVPPSMGSKVG